MQAVIFEVWPNEGQSEDYFSMALALKAELETVEGFISVERFESVTAPGKFYLCRSGEMKNLYRIGITGWVIKTHKTKVVKMFSRIIEYVSPVLFATTTWPLDAHRSVSK